MSVRKSSRISAIQSTNLFEDLVFTLSAETENDTSLSNQITKCGGKIQKTLTKKVTHVIANKNEVQAAKLQAKLKNAFANSDFKVITPNFIQDCIKKAKIISDKKYILKQDGSSASATSSPANSNASKNASTANTPVTTTTTTRKRSAAKAIDTTTTTTAAATTTTTTAAVNGNANKRQRVTKTKKDTAATTTTTTAATKKTTTKTTKKKTTKKDDDDDKDDDDEDDEDSKPKIVKEIRKGSTAVDTYVPNSDKYHVYETSENIYDAILNQTNISFNNNKFYNMQLLQSDSMNNYFVWFRWGRVGEMGQSKLQPCNSLNQAIYLFESKFKDKTGNRWEDRKDFVKKNKKYFLLERDYGVDENEEKVETKESKEEVKIPDSKLELKVQEIIKLIFDISMMEREMAEIGYDAKKMPLGKLTKEHIKKSFAVLKQLDEELLKTPLNIKNLSDLTSDFYTIIPHDFGRAKPPIINTKVLLKKKIEMVESLADIEIATKLLKSQNLYDENPIDTNYKSLNCGLVTLSHDSEEFKMIQTYVKNTHAKTHNSYTLEVDEVFCVDRNGENDRFIGKYHPEKKRKLLWHGSRLTNYAGILSQGLRIAPPEAPVTGYMFGKGVYFADMVSKSANYCNASKVGLMLLCEVMTGDENELLSADYNADETAKKANKDCTKGCGKTAPDPSKSIITKDGVEVPLGPAVDVEGIYGHLLYNEFIVYDVSQIKMKYLIKMNFNKPKK